MALHPNFPESPYEILDPKIRWFPADETLRNTSFEKLLPPLVPELRKLVKKFSVIYTLTIFKFLTIFTS